MESDSLLDELQATAFKAGMETALSYLEKVLKELPGVYLRREVIIEAIQNMRRVSREWTPPSEVTQ